MSKREAYSEPQSYQFERDGQTIQGTLEVSLTEEDGALTGASITLVGEQVPREARQAADALAQRLWQEGVDALSGATPAEAVAAVQAAARQCLDQFNEVNAFGLGDGENPASSESEGTQGGAGSASGPEGTEGEKSSGALKQPQEEPGAESILLSPPDTPQDPVQPASPALFFLAGLALSALVCGAAVWLSRRRRARQAEAPAVEDTHNSEWINSAPASRPPEETPATETGEEPPKSLKIGRLHNIGARPGQQDSLGVAPVPGGVLAVVADGMGGLADGDKVSQTIVRTMLGDAAQIGRGVSGQRLYALAARANRAVLSLLGPARRYQCGSTLISVLVQDGWLQWLSIGDSRICLYRAGRLLQLNREHTLEQELLLEAVNGRRTVGDVYQNPKRKGLTSFVGMGDLKHLDASPRPVRVQPGDRILLMTDGVFNTLSDAEIESVLAAQEDPVQAAAALEQQVLARKNPKQDNFTAILLEI